MDLIVLMFFTWVILEIAWELTSNKTKNKKMDTQKLEQLKELGFEKEVVWFKKNHTLTRKDFFMYYDKEENSLYVSKSEREYLNFNGITIDNVSIEEIKTLIVMLSKNEK